MPTQDRVILFVGRIEPLKGIDTLIQAMTCLDIPIEERPVLAIIGGDPNGDEENLTAEMARLQNLVQELSKSEMIIFLGKRGQDTLPYYYSAAEVLVMPSHYESFGMVALEAMACGTPVVASQVGGLAFLVKDGETGFHVPDQDPEALCEKLNILLKDEALKNKMGENAAKYAQTYAWEHIAHQITAVYHQLLFSRGEHIN